MAKQNLYALLGVDQGASNSAIEAAYQSACTALHDSADAHGPDAQNRLKFLRFARDTLVHAGGRAAYDASLVKPAVLLPPMPERSARARLPRSLVLALAGLLGVGMVALMFARSMPAKMSKPGLAGGSAVSAAAPQSAAGEGVQTDDSAMPALGAEQLFERYAQSVVVIAGLDGESKEILQGSGVVVADERVITNCHVAKSAAATEVRLGDRRYPARLLRVDADPEHDLCLLNVNGLHAPAIPLAAITSVKVGQKVFALGAPKGLELTLSEGIVSSLRKYGDSHFIQTTASISPGSSGGALFNETGALVGITTFQHTEGQNLNFAVPVDWVSKLLESKESLATLGPDGLSNLMGKWRCDANKGNDQMLYQFSRDGAFSMTRPSTPGQKIAGNYAIMGNHTLVLKDPNAEPPEVYVQIMSLTNRDLRISSPFYQDAQIYQCSKTES